MLALLAGVAVGLSQGCTPGGALCTVEWCKESWRMVRSALMLSCMSLGAVTACAKVVLIAWRAWMNLSSVVMFGLSSLWCQNQMGSLMMTAHDALVRTQ